MKRLFLHFVYLLALLFHSVDASAQDELLKSEIDSILQLVQNEKYADFKAFLNDVEKRSTNAMRRKLIGTFRKDENLSEVDRINIYRLAGIFARCQYKDAMPGEKPRLNARGPELLLRIQRLLHRSGS